MKPLEKTLVWLFPTLHLQGTPWLRLWLERERTDFVRIARILYPLISVAYLLHFFLFDLPMNLQPIEHWRYFRTSMSGLAFATFLFYCSNNFIQSRWYKLPAAIMGAVICHFQARVLVWYEESVYFYAFAFVILATIMLRTGVAIGLAYATTLFAVQWSSYIEVELDEPLLYSATVISSLFILMARSTQAAEVKYFSAAQENVANQRRLIELNIEFTSRLRAFLPREISRRLFGYVENQHMTVLQAIEEVLRPRHKDIACLFSDIRGFTKSTQGTSTYVDEGVIPNVRRCAQAIEDHGGIPRKVGDLIFAYFDSSDFQTNVRRCMAAAEALVEANISFNELSHDSVKIRRNVLVASGSAVVGNLGGFDSSIEITALGNPVNLLSRLDELVKSPSVRNRIDPQDIVLDERTAKTLREMPDFSRKLTELSLTEIGAAIRDFETIPRIWIYRADRVDDPDTTRNRTEGATLESLRYARGQIQALRPGP